MPGRPYLDIQTKADDINPAQTILDLAGETRHNNLENKKALLNSLERSMENVAVVFDGTPTFAPLTEAREKIESATTQTEYEAARKFLADSAEQFAQSDIGLQLNEIARQDALENIDAAFASEVSPEAQDQWSIFLRNLAAEAN